MVKNKYKQNKTGKCFIYCRVSSDRQVQGYSLGAQKDICFKKAKELGLRVEGVFVDEGETATVAERDEFMKMVEQCGTAQIESIIVYNTDRFARNTMDHFIIKDKLRKAGTNLISVVQPMLDDSPEGKLLDTFLAGINQFYSDDLSRKTKRGLEKKWDEGLWPGWAPVGYKNEKNVDGKNMVVPDPEVAKLVKYAFKRYAKGDVSIKKLAKIMHKKGLKTKSGKPLSHGTMDHLISNPFYFGKMVWNDKEKIGRHNPLISKKLFDLCQQVADQHGNYCTRNRKYHSKFLLRGVLECKYCGLRYTAQLRKNINSKKNPEIAYYRCQKRDKIDGHVCPAKYVEIEVMEKQVEKLFRDIKFSKKFIEKLTLQAKRYLKNRDKEEGKIRRKLLNKRNAIIAQRSTLEQRLLDETVNNEVYRRLSNKIISDLAGLDKELAKLDSTHTFDFDLLAEVLYFTRNVPKAYKEAPDFLKKKYLAFFFDAIIIRDKSIENTRFSPLVEELITQQEVILRRNMLEKWYEFGKIDWVSELEYPEWTVKEVNRFLQA